MRDSDKIIIPYGYVVCGGLCAPIELVKKLKTKINEQ